MGFVFQHHCQPTMAASLFPTQFSDFVSRIQISNKHSQKASQTCVYGTTALDIWIIGYSFEYDIWTETDAECEQNIY